MQQNIRYLDLMQERNILGFEMKNNDIVLPSSVCNPDVHCSPRWGLRLNYFWIFMIYLLIFKHFSLHTFRDSGDVWAVE